MRRYDVIIVGAGVVGSLIARALVRYELDVLLLEKAADVGEGTTKANTAIVHGGYDAEPGTLKARLNVAGNAMYDQLGHELDVEFDRCGTHVVAVGEEDLAALDDLLQRGKRNGVSGMSLLSREELLKREPSLTADATGSLFSATGGIVDPFQLCIGAAESAVLNGAQIMLETEALSLAEGADGTICVRTNRQDLVARRVIVSAGLWSGDLVGSIGIDPLPIRPRKGEYLLLDREAGSAVNGVLFPCPTPISKGILVTRTIHGNVMLGPNATHVDSRSDLETTAAGLDEVMSGALKLVPGIDTRLVIRTFAGLRASGSTGDFRIGTPKEQPNLVLLEGIESPGLTASPAIAEYVVELLREGGLELVERATYNPIRKGIPRFSRLDDDARRALIAQDPRYGRVICRCETVTEGEIVAACHAPIPARTYDGLKRRTRLGSGRCQGAFDTPRALEIMARELGVSPLTLTKRGGGSWFIARETKAVSV